MAHVSPGEAARYQKRAMTPAELIEADDHLFQCQECQQLLASQVPSGSAAVVANSLQETQRLSPTASPTLEPATQHLEYEQLEAWVDGALSPQAKTTLTTHLQSCSLCTADLEDLRNFKTELASSRRSGYLRGWLLKARSLLSSPRTLAWAGAFAVVVLLSSAIVLRRSGSRPVTPASNENLGQPSIASASLDFLSKPQREAVEKAIASQRIDAPGALANLRQAHGVLLGPDQHAASLPGGFAPLYPLGEIVPDTQPLFSWRPLTGASSYQVTIFDSKFTPVQTSPRLTALAWQPQKQLERGKTYLWQITAKKSGQAVTVPAPPNSEAKFAISDDATAQELLRLQNAHPEAHLVLGILYANAGMLNEAEAELNRIPGGDTERPTAQTLIQSIGGLRRFDRAP